jgi:hypothetical protein
VPEGNIRRSAAKRALDLDTGQTIITVTVGWSTIGIIMAFKEHYGILLSASFRPAVGTANGGNLRMTF